MPNPDKYKFLGDEIIRAKKTKDASKRDMMTFIYTNRLELCICASHPNFVQPRLRKLLE